MRILFSLVLIIVGVGLEAHAGRCTPGFGYETIQSKCRGYLPHDRARHVSNHRLDCSSNVDNYVRRPQPFNYEAWAAEEVNADGKDAAQMAMYKMRRQQPDVTWNGSIPYKTMEVWDWEECSYGADASACGTHSCNCHSTQNCSTDSKGRRSCSPGPEVCDQCANSCYHDVDEHESEFCTNEVMNYTAKYVKPSENEWNPKSPGYFSVIPNKYDLLPGEVEDVQVFNSSGESETLSPECKVGDAWNKYHSSINFDVGSEVCQHDVPPKHISVQIFTDGRKMGKQTPNAFRLPVSADNKPLDLIGWSSESDKSGKILTDGYPTSIQITDTSASMITAMARQSRDLDAKREEAKLASGKGASMSLAESRKREEGAGFFKKTRVRIQLMKKEPWYSRDDRVTSRLYTSDLRAVVHNQNAILNPDEEMRQSQLYFIPLHDGSSHGELYHPSSMISDSLWSSFEAHLEPKQKYYFKVSMYQEGVPFYAQDCKHDPGFLCKTFGRNEDSYYSKPLILPFKTENVDKRTMFEHFMSLFGGLL